MAFPSVIDYGAKGDGWNDDSYAFRQALVSNQTVTVPKGVFCLGNPVTVPEGQRLIGMGQQTIIKRRQDSSMDRMLRMNGRLEHVTIDGNWPSVSGGFDVETGDGGDLDHVTFRNMSDGAAQLASGSRVSYCQVIGPNDAKARAAWGLWFGGGGEQDIVIAHSTFRDVRMNAIFGSADSLQVLGCRFLNNHLQTDPSGGGQIDITPNGRSILIKDNYFGKSGAGGCAIEVDVADGLIISNNIIERQAGAGIVLYHRARDVLVLGNIIRDCGWRALTCDERINNLIWESNRFHNCVGGIRIDADAVQDHGNAVT